MRVGELEDKIRWLCARLVEAPPHSAGFTWYRSELKKAAAKMAAQEKEWNKTSEGDKHRDIARQSYRSREKDSADAFAEGLKLFNPKKPDFEKKKD